MIEWHCIALVIYRRYLKTYVIGIGEVLEFQFHKREAMQLAFLWEKGLIKARMENVINFVNSLIGGHVVVMITVRMFMHGSHSLPLLQHMFHNIRMLSIYYCMVQREYPCFDDLCGHFFYVKPHLLICCYCGVNISVSICCESYGGVKLVLFMCHE